MHRTTPARAHHGFTLVELLIVIAIISILVASIVGWLIAGQRRAENQAVIATMTIIKSALDRYKSTRGQYPVIDPTLDDAKANSKLLAELLRESQVTDFSGLKRTVPSALEGTGDVARFLGDSDGDWNPSMGVVDSDGVLIDGVEILDPWGQPLRYKAPGGKHDDLPGATDNSASYDLWSVGRNGIDEYDGTDPDEIDDWSNWLQRAEGGK